MTPGELLSVIEDADAAEPRGSRRRILEVRTPTLLGQRGKYLGHEVVDDEGTRLPVYGYTRRQALAIRALILEAAREDAQPDAARPLHDGFGNGVDE